MRSVVITGIGSFRRSGSARSRSRLARSRVAPGSEPITHFDASEFTTRFSAYIDDFDPSDSLNPKEARRMARFQQFAVVAAEEAVADAALTFDEDEADRSASS
jgi:3-oxoacyl-[acyl-carrier-protein] synthase II